MRSQVQRLILLEEEVTASGKGEVGAQIRLGLRYRLSERIRQSPEAYLSSGTIQLGRESAIPRSREPVLPLFVNRTRKVLS